MAILDEISAARIELAGVLDTLTDEQAATPSLCGAWDVHTTAGHLLWPLVTPIRVVVVGMVKAAGDFDKLNDRMSRRYATGHGVREIAEGIRAQAGSRFHAPGFGLEAPMAELVLHGQDIRRPLGLPIPTFAPDGLRAVLDLLASRKALRAFVPKGLHRGVRFEATDLDWSADGAGAPGGAVLSGPATSLAYAMTGRTASLGELSGPGLDVLRSR